MGPALTLGKRTVMTPLDYAALSDSGWEVPGQLLDLHGNANGDDHVDGFDLLHWQSGFGIASGALAIAGDVSGDGSVDQYDLWLWQHNYGAVRASEPLAAATQIPEPAVWSLLFGALATSACRARLIHSTPAISDLLITCTKQ